MYMRPCSKILLSTAQDASSRMHPKFSPNICRTISSRNVSSVLRAEPSFDPEPLPESRRGWCCDCGASGGVAGGWADDEPPMDVSPSMLRSRLRRRPPKDSLLLLADMEFEGDAGCAMLACEYLGGEGEEGHKKINKTRGMMKRRRRCCCRLCRGRRALELGGKAGRPK